MPMCMHTCILAITHGARAQLTKVGICRLALTMTHLSVIQAWKVEPEAAVLDPGTEMELGGAS